MDLVVKPIMFRGNREIYYFKKKITLILKIHLKNSKKLFF